MAAAAAAQPAASPESLGRVIEQAVAAEQPCAGALAVGITHGNVRADRFYGDTGKIDRPNADTEFGIGSITKTFTATLLAYALQQGTMRLNDPLAQYAPQGYTAPDFNGRQIELLHLATHTSALPRVVTNFRPPLVPEAMWRFTRGYRLTRPPGDQFEYSNLGYALLARAIVRSMKASEDQLYASVITRPLGMRDTAIAMTAAQQARLAQGYDPKGRPAPEFGPAFPAMNGAGGLRSTLNDMMRYLDFQLGKIDTPLRSLLPILHQPRHAKASQAGGSVGLAWQMRARPDGSLTVYHEGAMPGYSSIITFAPASATGAVILSSQGECPVNRIAVRIMGALNGGGDNPRDFPHADGQNWD
jgi:serine-type D-Ala-D-Ala carboxypeptidase/endopeptidase